MNVIAWWRQLAVLVAFSASFSAAQAQGVAGSTLDRIREHGAI